MQEVLKLQVQGVAGGLAVPPTSSHPLTPITSLPHHTHLVHNDVMFLDPLFSTLREVFCENVHNTMQELDHDQRGD